MEWKVENAMETVFSRNLDPPKHANLGFWAIILPTSGVLVELVV